MGLKVFDPAKSFVVSGVDRLADLCDGAAFSLDRQFATMQVAD